MSTITELKALIHDLVDTSTTTFSDARMVRGMNKAQDKVINIIQREDYLYQYDDSNYTDLAEGFLDITSGKRDYDLKEDENFADVIAIGKVFAKNSSGTWVELKRVESFLEITTGNPSKYYITGTKIILGDIPNYTSSGGLKIYFIRKPQPILTTDTTKEIGMPVTYHHLIALYTAYDFARAKRMDNRNDLLLEITEEEKRLGFFLASKNKSVTVRMRPNVESSR